MKEENGFFFFFFSSNLQCVCEIVISQAVIKTSTLVSLFNSGMYIFHNLNVSNSHANFFLSLYAHEYCMSMFYLKSTERMNLWLIEE